MSWFRLGQLLTSGLNLVRSIQKVGLVESVTADCQLVLLVGFHLDFWSWSLKIGFDYGSYNILLAAGNADWASACRLPINFVGICIYVFVVFAYLCICSQYLAEGAAGWACCSMLVMLVFLVFVFVLVFIFAFVCFLICVSLYFYECGSQYVSCSMCSWSGLWLQTVDWYCWYLYLNLCIFVFVVFAFVYLWSLYLCTRIHNILQQVRLVGPAAADCRLQLQESAGPSAARLHVAVSTRTKKLVKSYF